MTDLDHTHDPALRSWVASANTPDTDFPIQNLPLGMFRLAGATGSFRPGTAIGDQVLDLIAAADLGALSDGLGAVLRTCEGLMREAGNVVSVLVLVALLNAALREGRPRAMTIRALAQALRLPLETVRRHVMALVEAGLCARTAAGVATPPETLSRSGVRLLFADNATHVQRLLTGLAERGVILAWETPPALANLRA